MRALVLSSIFPLNILYTCCIHVSYLDCVLMNSFTLLFMMASRSIFFASFVVTSPFLAVVVYLDESVRAGHRVELSKSKCLVFLRALDAMHSWMIVHVPIPPFLVCPTVC